MMKENLITTLLLLSLAISSFSLATPLKPRVVVLTDISTWETDDHESLIRFLAHADLFEIEGLVISTGYSIKTLTKSPEKHFINIAHGVVNAYEKDLPNLMKRSNQVGHKFDDARQEIGYWPSPQYLRDRTLFGSLNRGKKFIGEDNDSPGSDLIIKLADEDDPRSLWVTVWGGGNTVAQSIYRAKKDRTAEQFKTFLHKIRVYTITDQDRHYRGEGLDVSAHGWIREQTGSDLLFIWDESAWKAHNGTGKSNWNQYATHIQGHGHMGSQYPKYKYGVEGDTPSFLYLMPTGLNDPEDPTQCSWGGTFKGNANNLWQPAGSCRSYFGRFYPAAFNNFAARMDWAKDGTGNRNPVIVLDGDDGISVLTKTPKQGTTVILDASKTFDPDGDKLKFSWWIQSEAGTYSGNINISNSRSSIATVNVPTDSAGKTFHVICEVADDGTHNLTSYRRIIFEPGLTGGKPRVIATSDGEIDDECSMVRFLLYANEWDVEAIVTSSSQYHWQGHRWAGDDWVEPYLDAYAQVYPNLVKHDPAFPTPEYLRERTVLGNVKADGEMDEVTAGSQLIVKVLLDETDDRPIWLQAWGGWGGQYVRVRENTWLDPVLEPGYEYPEGRWYTSSAWGRSRMREDIPNDQELAAYLKPMWRWFDAIQNDFAARADWCVKPYDKANHAPIVKLPHALDLKARPGQTVSLSAKGTTDPDGDALTYRWWQYQEADTYGRTAEIENTDHQKATLTIPKYAIDGETIHIICEVTDAGTPPLTRYQRVVMTIKK